ncbi:MAG: hypothetical protein JWO07_3 [Candidatus Saccharibacteria bacterium]|nr:hypothetical protein [Candidatus Saccharibacteria bacterium]
MNLLKSFGGLLQSAEPSYAPLGLAPHEAPTRLFGGRGATEFAISQLAIDRSVDRHQQIPEHVREFGKIALYSELRKQADRNMIANPSSVPEDALRGRMSPGRLVGLMERHKDLRAIELARLTHFGMRDVDHLIHNPVRRSLASHPRMELAEDENHRFKTDMRRGQMLAVSVNQLRAQHITKAMTARSRYLLIVDGHDAEVPRTKRDLKPAILDIVMSSDAYPAWLTPSLTTYFEEDDDRLETLEPRHRSSNPNMPVYEYSSEPDDSEE